MKILLTNIGNRNLTYKGKTYQDYDFSKQVSGNYINFRDWTFELLENWSENKEDLDINIINPLITGNNNYNLIILFYSDQTSFNTRTDQDTLHEANLIENILVHKYSFDRNVIKPIKVDSIVIDNSGLLNFYRNELIKLKRIGGDFYFTICDAGGTAQQKMALKVMAEFLLKPNQYEVLYVEKNKLISDVNVNEYRKVINVEQAITLIHNGEYMAAAVLLDIDYLTINKSKWKDNLFLHVFYRFTQNNKMAKLSINALKNTKEPILLSYKNNEAFAENEELCQFFGHVKWIKLIDLFYKAIFYYNQKKFSQAVLSFAHFYESFLLEAFKKEYKSTIYGNEHKQTEEEEAAFHDVFKNHYHNFIDINPSFRIQMGSIMVQVMLMKVSPNNSVNKVARLLSPYFSYTDDSIKVNDVKYLNNVRNSIAHDGKNYSEDEFCKDLPYFEALIENLKGNLGTKSADLFRELNILIEEGLRS